LIWRRTACGRTIGCRLLPRRRPIGWSGGIDVWARRQGHSRRAWRGRLRQGQLDHSDHTGSGDRLWGVGGRRSTRCSGGDRCAITTLRKL
jgi:hypothetical protein